MPPAMPSAMPSAFGKRCITALLSLLTALPAAAQSPVQKVQLLPVGQVPHLAWTVAAADPKGDGLHPRLPDAKELSYAIDPKAGMIWFKVSVYDPLPERWFGINVAIDDDQNPDNGMVWWGSNKFKFDRLASAYLYHAEDYWQGLAGVADSEAVGRGIFANVSRDVKVALDREQRAIILGVPRSALAPTTQTIRVIATVGSMLVNNDDVPNEGAVTIKLNP